MKDITHLFTQYRECVLQIWNNHLVKARKDDLADAQNRWLDSCVPIFRALILYPLDYDDPDHLPDYRGEHDMLPYIKISPIRESEILINAAIDSGVWS